MAELNLKQITDRLNAEFVGDTRKLVFWYDDKGEFEEDVKEMRLVNAQVYFLRPDNQFYTKYLLERKDTTTNYLIYAPFPKPEVRENHLEDTLLYSKRFFADRASLLSVDLGIDEKYKPIIEKHIKFFANKERTQRFYDLEIENFNEENILVGLLSALCMTKTCSFEEVVRIILTDSTLQENKYLAEMEKFDLLPAFWKLCEQQFGYLDDEPTLECLLLTMFVTYTGRYVHDGLPRTWQQFSSHKSGNIIAFLDHLMNNVLYRDKYNELSAYAEKVLNVSCVFAKQPPEVYVSCDTFIAFDRMLVKWIVERLLDEDTGAELDSIKIPRLCEKRMKMHFGDKTQTVYRMLHYAYQVICVTNYQCIDGFAAIIEKYENDDWKIDRAYREFYYAFDYLEQTESFEALRELVENIYTNEYLAKQLPKWNAGIQEKDAFMQLPLQRNFYNRYVKNTKERTVVIISDAMRYEVGQELHQCIQDDPKSTVRLEAMLSILPSYTRLGMAALLPHKILTMTDMYEVLADDISCNDLAGRQKVLQKYAPDSICIQFDELKNMKKAELRAVFTGKQVVYVYHNQIDARGDKLNTENETFTACEEAVQEIYQMIQRINGSANTHRFIITADHGFIYKRDKVMESDKIGGIDRADAFINRRFIVSHHAVEEDGVNSIGLGYTLGNQDKKIVSYPISSNVFQVAGGGQNFVHGGSSPQEMLIPVLDIKMERGKMETRTVQITMVSQVQKITNKITNLDFIQSDAVNDIVKAAVYKIYFVSEDDDTVSNINIHMADSRETDAAKRIFRLRFNFKDQKYVSNRPYYLIIVDINTGLEIFRHPVIVDLAMVDDFGFGF